METIKQAIKDIQTGKMVIVVDNEDRENEGDVIIAAEKVTPEIINFMATHCRGLICVPLAGNKVQSLALNQMVDKNIEYHKTKFTISVLCHSTPQAFSASLSLA